MNVTHQPRRYVAVCAGCDLLFQKARRDQLTCSAACRVQAHRSGSLKRWRDVARQLDIPAALIGMSEAIERLRPDLEVQVMRGEIKIVDTMPALAVAFDKIAMEAAYV